MPPRLLMSFRRAIRHAAAYHADDAATFSPLRRRFSGAMLFMMLLPLRRFRCHAMPC